MIKTNDNNKKLFVCGGETKIENSELFDFVENKWSSMKGNCNTYHSGICYDRMSQMVYVGGGRKWKYDYRHTRASYGGIYSYDLTKNKWCELPNTWMDYEYRPNIWVNERNPNLLFIASAKDDSLEYIDLRQHERYWKVIRSAKYGKYHDNALVDVFGLEGFTFYPNVLASTICIEQY